MKKKLKFFLAVFFLVSAILFYWQFSCHGQIFSFILFTFLLLLSGYLFGLLRKGTALALTTLNKNEKVKILSNIHPANYKLGDKRNVTYYILKREVDKKIYFFKGEENYHHLPFKNFDFIWNGKKLIPQKS